MPGDKWPSLMTWLQSFEKTSTFFLLARARSKNWAKSRSGSVHERWKWQRMMQSQPKGFIIVINWYVLIRGKKGRKKVFVFADKDGDKSRLLFKIGSKIRQERRLRSKAINKILWVAVSSASACPSTPTFINLISIAWYKRMEERERNSKFRVRKHEYALILRRNRLKMGKISASQGKKTAHVARIWRLMDSFSSFWADVFSRSVLTDKLPPSTRLNCFYSSRSASDVRFILGRPVNSF